MTIITVNNLVKHYQINKKNIVKAVDGVSFTIKAGHCFGLLGPNGAGKTTTIEILEGIISASSGEVLYHGEALNKNIASKIGIQFQHTALQDFLTVQETLNLFSSFYDHTIAQQTLVEMCDLQDFLNRNNRLLSGGQKQRLLLALALINDPDIVFLDEPTTGLDPQARRNFWQLIKNIKAQHKTIILTTHYMDEAEHVCDEIAVMDKGKLIEQGTPPQLLQKHFSDIFIYLPKAQVPNELMIKNNWQIIDKQVEIKSKNVEKTLTYLIEKQVPLAGLHVKSANLDDLFLKLTGHSLRD
ncbi:MAG: ABC transporter ATP-binding protein [Alteromonadaceae bacterium]|nr:ABC transporter ATP-binding protein [Alteromonadaceae bacterium]